MYSSLYLILNLPGVKKKAMDEKCLPFQANNSYYTSQIGGEIGVEWSCLLARDFGPDTRSDSPGAT